MEKSGVHDTRQYMILISVLLVCISVVEGVLEIDTPWPFYVEAGSNLTLVCTSNSGDRLDLFWERQTPASERQRERIEPVQGDRFITRYLMEEPSGYRENTLIIKNMTIQDRDWYYCMSDQHFFQIEAIVLKILPFTVLPTPTEDEVDTRIDCDLVGFASNTPVPEVVWYYKGRMISIYDHHKYQQSILDVVGASSASLVIKDTVREDTGPYTCTFLLGTTREDFQISKEIYLDVAHLDRGTTPSTGTTLRYEGIVIMSLITYALLF